MRHSRPKRDAGEYSGGCGRLTQAFGHGLHRPVLPAPASIHRAHAGRPVTALQTEYSSWSPDPEAEILPTIRNLDQLDEDDFRRSNPRVTGQNLQVNIALVEQVDAVAAEVGATPAQVALAWLLALGDDIAPIPETRQIKYLEENIGADALALAVDQLARLGFAASGCRGKVSRSRYGRTEQIVHRKEG